MGWRSVHMNVEGRIIIELSTRRASFEVGIRGHTMHWFRVGAAASLCGRASRLRMREIDTRCFSLHTTPCSSCLANLGRE